jgi:hypothetical protein
VATTVLEVLKFQILLMGQLEPDVRKELIVLLAPARLQIVQQVLTTSSMAPVALLSVSLVLLVSNVLQRV